METTHIANPVSVQATRILDVTDVTDRSEGSDQSSPDLMLRLEDGRNFKADAGMTARYTPVPGDYVVTQEDGYTYLNPKDVFERKYRPADAAQELVFGERDRRENRQLCLQHAVEISGPSDTASTIVATAKAFEEFLIAAPEA
jgi:hypothetical protein